MKLIGRKNEQEELRRLSQSEQAEFAVVYGRRRVGKTYLIRSFFKDNFTFYTTGIARGSRKDNYDISLKPCTSNVQNFLLQ